MNIKDLERANLLVNNLMPKVDDLLNISSRSRNDVLSNAIWGLSKYDKEFETKFNQLLNETKQRFQKEFDEI